MERLSVAVRAGTGASTVTGSTLQPLEDFIARQPRSHAAEDNDTGDAPRLKLAFVS